VNSKAIDGFYKRCKESPLIKQGPVSHSTLKFMFFAWLESIADSADEEFEAATTEEKKDYERIINNSSNELSQAKYRIEDAAIYSSLEARTENFKKEILENPSNPKLLIDFFDFVHKNDIRFDVYLLFACERFINVHLRSPATSSTAILFFLLYNLLHSHSIFSNEKSNYNTTVHMKDFKPSFEYNSMMLYLTHAWLERKCNLKANDYSLFWKTYVYKYKLLIKLDARIAEIEKNLPAIDTMDLDTLTEESKVLLTEYFTLKELQSVVELFSYFPEYFYWIPSVIPKSRELVKFLKENLDFFEFTDGQFKSSERPDIIDPFKEQYVFKVLDSDIEKHKADPSFSENFTEYLKDYISKLEFKLTILTEKSMTDTFFGLLDSIALDVIPDYQPPFPFNISYF
jgi:hypothetical protein